MDGVKYTSLKREFIAAFLKILILSFIFSLVTFALYFGIFEYFSRPANYYEKMLPKIMEEVRSSEDILKENNEEKLNRIIPKEGIEYQVYNLEGKALYGNSEEILVDSKLDLMNNINKNISKGKNVFLSSLALLNENSDIIGFLVFRYELNPSMKIDSQVFDFFTKALLFFPFIYIVIFTLYYSRKIGKKINEPIAELMTAVEKIRSEDLDFEISYGESNELGDLARSFEEMRRGLKNSLERQWQLEESRRENFEAIAHDVRTPLTIVKTYSEKLLEGNYNEKTKKYLDTIYRNNERAIILVENINEISSIEADNFRLDFEYVDLMLYLKDKLEEMNFLAKDKSIDFKWEIVDNRNEACGYYDLIRINQVVDNIFSNGLRYSSGSIIMTIEMNDEGPVFQLENSSEDKLSEEDLRNAFNKFYKGDKSRSFSRGHSGLGLYISRIIVELHAGSIAIENTDLGVKVSFNLLAMEKEEE